MAARYGQIPTGLSSLPVRHRAPGEPPAGHLSGGTQASKQKHRADLWTEDISRFVDLSTLNQWAAQAFLQDRWGVFDSPV